MSVQGITAKCWILALFIRDDGERLVLGDGAYDFKDSQQHFVANEIVNDTVDVQGNDGILLAGQVRRAATQAFDGYVGDATTLKTETETLRRQFIAFFAKNHFYRVVYILPDGSAVQRQRGFLVEAPEVKELWQLSPEYHVALNFEDVNYYSYSENNQGEEIFANSVALSLSDAEGGGLVWDEVGIVFDEIGAVWEAGTGGGLNMVTTDGIQEAYPIWVVKGPISNPTLENVTTNTTITYNGALTASQTLVVNMEAQTATLNGTNVVGALSGNWLTLAPGVNRISFVGANNVAQTSTLEWQEIVG